MLRAAEHYRFCPHTIRPTPGIDAAGLQALAERKTQGHRTVPQALKSFKVLLPCLKKLLELAAVLRQAPAGQMDRSISIFPCLTSNPSVTCLCQKPGGKPPGLALWRYRHSIPFSLAEGTGATGRQALGKHLAALICLEFFAVIRGGFPPSPTRVARPPLPWRFPGLADGRQRPVASELAAAFRPPRPQPVRSAQTQ